jgi:putative peptidoglycan lipid II flippase
MFLSRPAALLAPKPPKARSLPSFSCPGYNRAVKRQTILAGASIMAVAALLSRILGWVRDRAIGHFWGRTPHTEAYWAAFMVPDLLYYLLAGGALSASVIPVLTAYLRRNEEAESWKITNTLVTFFGLCAIIGVTVIMLFAPGLVTLAAAGFRSDPAKAAECARYVRILAPMVFFTVLSALFTGILQSHRHFTAPALAWLVYNFGIIGGAYLGGGWVARRYHSDALGLKVLAGGVVVGAVLLVVVQIPSLVARGFRYRLTLDLRHPGVREALRLFVPYMAGLAFTQICLLWLPSFFGSYFPLGVTSLRYANRLVVLPLGLFGIAISTAAFPVMAERIHAGEMGAFRRLFSGSIRSVFLLSVPSAAGLIVLAGPILRLLWRSGKFGEGDISATEFCLIYYAAALIGLSGLQVVNRAFYSLKDIRTPPLVGIGYTVIIVALALGLMHSQLQYASVAAATSVGVTVGLVVMFEVLRKRLGGIDGRAIAISFSRVVLASLALAAAAFWVSRWSGQLLGVPPTHFAASAPSEAASAAAAAPIVRVAAQVVASIAAGAVAYAAVLRLLGAPELAAFAQAMRNRKSEAAPAAPVG